MSVRKARPWDGYRTVVDQHGQTPAPPADHEIPDGEHHWLCPAHMTAEARDLADKIGETFKAEVERAAEEDALGSVGELYAALWLDTGEADLDDADKGQRWLELMSMSLGYWLDCLVLDDVVKATGATAEQCHDVALLREMIRKQETGGMRLGVTLHRVGRDD